MAARSRSIDRAFVLTAAAVTLLFLVPKLFQHAAAHTGDMDTGNYSNLAWAIGHGEGFSGSVTGRHHLGEHFSPIMLLVAPVYLVWANGYVLMILQALGTAATIALVLRFFENLMRGGTCHPERNEGSPTQINSEILRCARDEMGPVNSNAAQLRMLGTALLLILFLFYPPLLATWGSQFQPIELGMPLVV